jgi:hypothetical protein
MVIKAFHRLNYMDIFDKFQLSSACTQKSIFFYFIIEPQTSVLLVHNSFCGTLVYCFLVNPLKPKLV